MRVLVTRAMEDAEDTAQALRARGHQPVLAPLRRRLALDPALPEGPFAAVLASSRHAFAATMPRPALAALRGLPCYCVGEKTAAAARAAGFVRAGAPGCDGASLGAALARRLCPGTRLLYLAGRPRHPALERGLAAHRLSVAAIELYAMEPLAGLPQAALEALDLGLLDAVLHYSPQSAQAFLAALAAAGRIEAGAAPRHLCLSPAVAAVLPAEFRIGIAAQASEEALLARLAAEGEEQSSGL